MTTQSMEERFEIALSSYLSSTELPRYVAQSVLAFFRSELSLIKAELLKEVEEAKGDEHISGVMANEAFNQALNTAISIINKVMDI